MIPLPLSLILPLARRWVDGQEARILAHGVPLDAAGLADAQQVGVNERLRVRLCRVRSIPMPMGGILRRASERARLISQDTTGITFGHGIYIREDCWGERQLLVHELVHVAQYERYGSTARFLRAYLGECLTIGYPHGLLEQEALNRTREICG